VYFILRMMVFTCLMERSLILLAQKKLIVFSRGLEWCLCREHERCSVDPLRQIIVWSYASTASTNGSPDKLIIYNYALGKWSTANIAVDVIAPVYTAGYTLEALDAAFGALDILPASLDGPVYRGGEFYLLASKDNKIQTFTGEVLDAQLKLVSLK
jgi:hypothetical protein